MSTNEKKATLIETKLNGFKYNLWYFSIKIVLEDEEQHDSEAVDVPPENCPFVVKTPQELNEVRIISLELIGYSDASFANSLNSRSISGYGFLLSGALTTWYAHTQPVVALNTAEAEYIAFTDAVKEAIWLKLLLKELGYPQGNVTIYEDNQATIKIAKNPQDHKRTKHIQIKYHYIRDQIRDGEFHLEYVKTADQLGDMFTKGINGPRLRSILQKVGMTKIGGG